MAKRCLNCRGSMEGKKKGAKYCSDTCRASHHAEMKNNPEIYGLNGTPNTTQQGALGILGGSSGFDPVTAVLINQAENQKVTLQNELDRSRQEVADKSREITAKEAEVNSLKLEIVNLKNQMALNDQSHKHQVQLSDLEHANASGLNGFLDHAKTNPEAFANAAATILESIKGLNTQAAVEVQPMAGTGPQFHEMTLTIAKWFQALIPSTQEKFITLLKLIKKTGFKAEAVMDEIIEFVENDRFTRPMPKEEAQQQS